MADLEYEVRECIRVVENANVLNERLLRYLVRAEHDGRLDLILDVLDEEGVKFTPIVEKCGPSCCELPNVFRELLIRSLREVGY